MNVFISDVLDELGITEYYIDGNDPTNEEEFLKVFKKVVGQDENEFGIISEDPNDFGVTWAQIEAKIPEVEALVKLKFLRYERDLLLAETDWWVLPDRTPTQEQLDYRQALRDITNTYTSLDDVIWPTKPE